MTILYLLLPVLILCLAYLCCVSPGHRKLPENLCRNYAHRGLHDDRTPENSLAAFEAAAASGYGIELDIQLSRDGEVVVFHDALLERMTGAAGKVCEYTLAELKNLALNGTDQKIPTLREVLDTVDGRVPLLVELKGESTDTAVCPAADSILRDYKGAYLVESFNPLLLRWYKKNRPDVFRGQLTTNLISGMGKTARNRLLDSLLLNAVTRPDVIAYDIRFPNRFPLRLCIGFFRAHRFVWTIHSEDEYKLAGEQKAFAIFEQFCPPTAPVQTPDPSQGGMTK
ncbi:MAG: glycerophosphodiester phosphodiesterase [Clostridia bacterium]|nr:glycerophosphodiester phosphodiesterase [Clostridia bacterium]